MRTTITIDDDVSIGLQKLQKKFPKKSFKAIVNQVMKQGLAVSEDAPNVKFKIEPVNAIPHPHLDFDDISKLIEVAEGDFHK